MPNGYRNQVTFTTSDREPAIKNRFDCRASSSPSQVAVSSGRARATFQRVDSMTIPRLSMSNSYHSTARPCSCEDHAYDTEIYRLDERLMSRQT